MRKKGAFWIVIRLESLILRTCERKALAERNSCVCILEMRSEAMHDSKGQSAQNKILLAVRRSCSWSGRYLQCLWTHLVQITHPIRKRIVIRYSYRNVIRSFVNRPCIMPSHPMMSLQIEGGFMQGYGYFTMEEIRFNQEGAMLSDGPDTYKIPTALDIPKQINVTLLRNLRTPEDHLYSSKVWGCVLLTHSEWRPPNNYSQEEINLYFIIKLATQISSFSLQISKTWCFV